MYTGSDYIIIPPTEFNFCEKCGELYGNCEHHPIKANRVFVTKKELKKIMKESKPTYTNLDKII